MKIKLLRKFNNLGNALLVTTILCALLSIGVMSYLSVVEQENLLSARSQAWNMAMAVTEAGIEEGLEQLNTNDGNLGADGWSYDGTYYWRTNTFPDGDSYTVQIDPRTFGKPYVTARAYVNLPVCSTTFGAIGLTTGNTTVNRQVRVSCSQANLVFAALAARNGIDLKGNPSLIDSYDSSDPSKSSGGQYNPSQYQGDKADIYTCAGITNSVVTIQDGNVWGHIHTGPEPGNDVSVGPNGAVGSIAWQTGGNTGFQPGWVLADSNFEFPATNFPSLTSPLTPLPGNVVLTTYNVSSNSTTSATCPSPAPLGGVQTNTYYTNVSSLPSPTPAGTVTNTQANFASSFYPPAGTYVGPVTTNIVTSGPPSGRGTWYIYSVVTGYSYPAYTYTYNLYATNVVTTTNFYQNILNSGDYEAPSLSGSTIVTGTARLVLPNGLNMATNDAITIAPQAQLVLYNGGSSVSISGHEVMNYPGIAGSFWCICGPTVTSFSCAGNSSWVGVLVAPSANATLNGGGNNVINFCGSMMVNSLNINGHLNLHYDEALRKAPPTGRLLVTGWSETTFTPN